MQEELNAFERFTITMEFLMELHVRHPQAIDYSLIHVCFHDRQRLGVVYGAKEAAKMLVDLAKKLRQSFRKTDLVARDGVDFWILAPCTTPENVSEKVTTLIEMASDLGLDVVERDVAVFSMPDRGILEGKSFDRAADFLAHLKSNRSVKFRWEPIYMSA